MAISKQDVFRAADAMFAEGQQPTLISLRKVLGSGSFSTIMGYLSEWKTASRTGEVVAVSEVPSEVSELFASALAGVWQKACDVAAVKVEEVTLLAQKQVSAAVEAQGEALALAQDLEAENASLRNQLNVSNSRNDEALFLIESQRVEIAKLVATEREFRTMHAEFVAALKQKPLSPAPAPAKRKKLVQGELDNLG